MHGKFHGNRFAVIGDRLVLIDDECNLAVYPTFEPEQNTALGFYFLKVIDRSEGNYFDRSVNEELSEYF